MNFYVMSSTKKACRPVPYGILSTGCNDLSFTLKSFFILWTNVEFLLPRGETIKKTAFDV
jgi:hypothetical protein